MHPLPSRIVRVLCASVLVLSSIFTPLTHALADEAAHAQVEEAFSAQTAQELDAVTSDAVEEDAAPAAEDAAPTGTLTRALPAETPEFGTDEYLQSYEVKPTAYQTDQPDSSGYPLSNAFDGNWNTRWKAETSNQTTTLTLTFASMTDVSRIIYKADVDGGGGGGYPKDLTLRVSADDTGSFTDVANLKSDNISKAVVFSLAEPVRAKRIQLVFGDPYIEAAAASEIKILKRDETLYDVERLFTDGHMNKLRPEYNSEEKITELRAAVESHPMKDRLLARLDIASKILTGEIDETDRPDRVTDFPVHVIQRTGSDDQRLVLVFVGEGYTASEQESFKSAATERARQLLQREPYRQYADMFNIYAVCVESAESGVYASPHNTYFKIHTGANGVDRAANFSGDGAKRMDALVKQVEENYLDEGAHVFHAAIICNSWGWFGAAVEGYSISALTNGVNVVEHEMSHAFASLADEYSYSTSGSWGGVVTNVTSNSDPNTVIWKEWLGYGNVGVYSMGDGRNYIPTYYCIMRDATYDGYCPVCQAHVDEVLNRHLPAELQHKAYVASPQLTLYRGNQLNVAQTTLDPSNFATLAKDDKIEWRTMVKNYGSQEQTYTMKFEIKGSDGTVKHTYEQSFTVKPGAYNQTTKETQAQSLSIVTETLTDIKQGDTYAGTVTDDAGNEVASTSGISYKTLTVNYKISGADGTGTQDVPSMGVGQYPVLAGEHNIKGPDIAGYTYVGSSAGDKLNVTDDTSLTYYYVRNKGKVTMRLLDGNGEVKQTKERWIAYKSSFTPQASDFSAPAGKAVEAPAAVTFNGVDDMQVDYRLVDSADPVPPATTDTVPPATTDTVPPATTDPVPPATTDTVPPTTTDTVPPVSPEVPDTPPATTPVTTPGTTTPPTTQPPGTIPASDGPATGPATASPEEIPQTGDLTAAAWTYFVLAGAAAALVALGVRVRGFRE